MTLDFQRHLLKATGVAVVALLAALIVSVSASSTVRHLDHRAVSAAHEEAVEHEYDGWSEVARPLGRDSTTLAIACIGVVLLMAIGRRRDALMVGFAFVLT